MSVTPTIIAFHMHMIHTCKECEMVAALHDPKPKTTPLQGIRRVLHDLANLRQRELTMMNWYELDVGGILDRTPDYLSVAVVLEPAAIGIVPSEMGVDHVVGRPDIALAGLLAADDHQPRVVESLCLLLAIAPNMLRLHITDRNIADRRLRRFRVRDSRRSP